MKIGFIGTGNMGGAILKSYVRVAEEQGNEVLAFNRTKAKAEALLGDVKKDSGKSFTIEDSLDSLVKASDIVFVCVEPQNFGDVIPQVAASFSNGKVLVSIAAGITIEYLENALGKGAKIVRTMPNTPIMHGLGATALVRNANITDEDMEKVKAVFEAGGITGEVTEDLIGAVIGVSGSSPAYTYMYIDALIKVGTDNGLDEELAKRFAAQAVMGAGKMVLTADETPAQLCDNVCSPGGTTIEAVKTLRADGFEELVVKGAQASVDRAEEMSK
ncbi:MAG: pyrroline-5-carboxylate reductase [Firmicutes bacterium]|nr:pyrroline-5-carboxylate reductase [Bacillota bacterium]